MWWWAKSPSKTNHPPSPPKNDENANNNNNKEISKVIVSHGRARANKKDTERVSDTALMHAAELGYKEVCEVLIAQGADVNCCNILKDTPLGFASAKGHTAVTELLLLCGAKISPFHFRYGRFSPEIREMMETYTLMLQSMESIGIL